MSSNTQLLNVPGANNFSSTEPVVWQPVTKGSHALVLYPFIATNQSNARGTNNEQPPKSPAAQTTPSGNFPFSPYPSQLVSLGLGDTVHILEEFGGWYRGYVFSGSDPTVPPKLGIFPANHVKSPSTPRRPSVANSLSGLGVGNVTGSDKSRASSNPPERVLKSALRKKSLTGSSSGINVQQLLNESQSQTNKSPPAPARTNTNASLTPSLSFLTDRQSLPSPILPIHSTYAGQSEPLIDEIGAVLREWGLLLRESLLQRNYEQYQLVKDLFSQLFQGRRQLLLGTLSLDEASKLRRELLAKIESGNLMLGLDMIIRHPEKGFILTEENASILKFYKLHAQGSRRDIQTQGNSGGMQFLQSNQPEFQTAPATMSHANPSHQQQLLSSSFSGSQRDQPISILTGITRPETDDSLQKRWHVLFELRQCGTAFLAPNERLELSFAIYNRNEGRFVTEDFSVELLHTGVPVDPTQNTLRTLFTDLTIRDIHEHMFLVCKLIRIGKMQGSDVNPATPSSLPHSSSSHPNLLQAALSASHYPSSQSGTMYRRPHGAAVMEIGDLLQGMSDNREFAMKIVTASSESTFSSLYEYLIGKSYTSGGNNEMNPGDSLLLVNMRNFQGDLASIHRIYGNLFTDVPVTPRIGVSDVILPGDNVNAVYLTINEGDFNNVAKKMNVKSIGISVQVRMADGKILERCISRATGVPRMDTFETVVYHHNLNPRWMETIRLDIPVENFQKAHVFFVLRQCSSKEKSASDREDNRFAFGYLPLVRGTNIINDGLHSIALYKWEEKFVLPTIYLGLPPWVDGKVELPPDVKVAAYSADQFLKTGALLKDFLIARTVLCSTKLTQSLPLLNLLNWTRLLAGGPANISGSTIEAKRLLVSMLREFSFIGELEIIKFLPNILEALFAILAHPINADSDLDDAVFSALIVIISTVTGTKFSNHRQVVDNYTAHTFKKPRIWKNLANSLRTLLENPTIEPYAKDLRSTIKVWHYVFRWMIKSYFVGRMTVFQSSLAPQKQSHRPKVSLETMAQQAETEFKDELRSICREINNIMSATPPETVIGSQVLALQHFTQIIPDLLFVFDPKEIVDIVVSFADSVVASNHKMLQHKLLFIHSLLKSVLFTDGLSRIPLLKAAVRWISECLRGDWESQLLNGSSRDNTANSSSTGPKRWSSLTAAPSRGLSRGRKDVLKLCLVVLADLLDKLYDLKMYSQETSRSGDLVDVDGEMERAVIADMIPVVTDAFLDIIMSGSTDVSVLSSPPLGGTFAAQSSSIPEASNPAMNAAASGSTRKSDYSGTVRSAQIAEKSVAQSRPRGTSSVGLLGLFSTSSVNNAEDMAPSMNAISPPLPPLPSQDPSAATGIDMTATTRLTNTDRVVTKKLGRTGSSDTLDFLENREHFIMTFDDICEFGVVYLALFGLLDQSHLTMYLRQFLQTNDRQKACDFVIRITGTWQLLLSSRIFTANCVMMNMLMGKICVRVISSICDSDILKSTTTNLSNLTALLSLMQKPWLGMFRVLVMTLNHQYMQYENYGAQTRRLIARMSADVRATGGELLRKVWQSVTTVLSPTVIAGGNAGSLTVSTVTESMAMQHQQQVRGYLQSLIPALIGPCVEMSTSAHVGLRVCAVDLLSSLIESDFILNRDLKRVTNELIESLDQLVMTQGKGTEAAKSYLIQTLRRRLSGDAAPVTGDSIPISDVGTFVNAKDQDIGLNTLKQKLEIEGGQLLDILTKFLDLSFTVRDLPVGEEYDDERMTGILRLIKFIKVIDRKQIYIKYINYLIQMQLRHANPVEAANIVRLHADSLEWSDKQVDAYPVYGFPTKEKSRDRKERLYRYMLELFQSGRAWEHAIEVGRVLITEHEVATRDYLKLADVLKSQATMYESIVREERFPSSYFRVGFYGKGWPPTTRDKQFIYRGAEYEKISTFVERLLNRYAGSGIVKGNGAVSGDIMCSSGMYMQIVAVKPEPGDILRKIKSHSQIRQVCHIANGDSVNDATSSEWRNSSPETLISALDLKLFDVNQMSSRIDKEQSGVAQYIRDYYLSNEVQLFSFDRPIKKPMIGKSGNRFGTTRPTTQQPEKSAVPNEFLELWTEKTLLVSEDTFPCLLRRSEVVHVKTFEYSPIENAVIAMINKNRELLGLERQFHPYAYGDQKNITINCNPLTMSLNGAVDAPVNGGVPMYKKAFLNNDFKSEFPQWHSLVDKLQAEILEQVRIIARCLDIHEHVVPESMRPLHSNLVSSYCKNFADEITLIERTSGETLLSPPLSPVHTQHLTANATDSSNKAAQTPVSAASVGNNMGSVSGGSVSGKPRRKISLKIPLFELSGSKKDPTQTNAALIQPSQPIPAVPMLPPSPTPSAQRYLDTSVPKERAADMISNPVKAATDADSTAATFTSTPPRQLNDHVDQADVGDFDISDYLTSDDYVSSSLSLTAYDASAFPQQSEADAKNKEIVTVPTSPNTARMQDTFQQELLLSSLQNISANTIPPLVGSLRHTKKSHQSLAVSMMAAMSEQQKLNLSQSAGNPSILASSGINQTYMKTHDEASDTETTKERKHTSGAVQSVMSKFMDRFGS